MKCVLLNKQRTNGRPEPNLNIKIMWDWVWIFRKIHPFLPHELEFSFSCRALNENSGPVKAPHLSHSHFRPNTTRKIKRKSQVNWNRNQDFLPNSLELEPLLLSLIINYTPCLLFHFTCQNDNQVLFFPLFLSCGWKIPRQGKLLNFATLATFSWDEKPLYGWSPHPKP